LWFKERWRLRQQRKEPPPRLITDRWRYTPAAFDVGTLANLGTRGFSNHAYLQSSEKLPPSVRVGAFVACAALEGDEPTAEYLRSRMREFLGQPEVMRLIGRLTSVDADADWHSLPGHGRFNLEADLLGRDGVSNPSPLLNCSSQNRASCATDLTEGSRTVSAHRSTAERRCAGQAQDRRVGRVVYRRTGGPRIARTVPRGRRYYDVRRTGSSIRGADQSEGNRSNRVDELIDFDGLAVLSPQRYSMQFDGWAVADQQGKTASAVSKRFLTELCESTGRTGYESFLAGLDGGTHQQDEGSEPTSGTLK